MSASIVNYDVRHRQEQLSLDLDADTEMVSIQALEQVQELEQQSLATSDLGPAKQPGDSIPDLICASGSVGAGLLCPRFGTPSGPIDINLIRPTAVTSTTTSSLAALTQRENQRLAAQISALFQVRTGQDHEQNGIEDLLRTWASTQGSHTRDFTATVQSISAILESTQSRAHYSGATIFDDIAFKDNVDQGQPFHCKVMADLSTATSHLKLDLRSLGDGQLQMFISTQQPYPDIRAYIWASAGSPALYKSITISGRDPHAIHGWYYIAIEANQTTTFSLKATVHIDENGRSGRARANSDGGPTTTVSAASHKTIHDRIKNKIEHFAHNPEAKAALRARIIQYRKLKTCSMSGARNLVEENAAESACLRYTPEQRQAARQRWSSQHDKRLAWARTRMAQDQDNLAQQRAQVIDRYRNLFAQRTALRLQILRRRSLQQLQKKWLIWATIGVIHYRWGQHLLVGRVVRQGFIRRQNAALIICRFIDRSIMRRRYRQARRMILSVRSIIRLCAVNNQIMMRHRATDVIKQFLESAAGVQKNLSTIIRNFRHRVLILQRFHTRWRSLRDARLQLWTLQWDSLKGRNREDMVPDEIRAEILKETMKRYRRDLLKNRAVYEAEMKDYLKKKKIEDAKRMINADGNETGLQPPSEPHLPITLPKKVVLQLIAEGRKRSAITSPTA